MTQQRIDDPEHPHTHHHHYEATAQERFGSGDSVDQTHAAARFIQDRWRARRSTARSSVVNEVFEPDAQFDDMISMQTEELVKSFQQYIRTHAELRQVLNMFMSNILLDKPENIHSYAKDYFVQMLMAKQRSPSVTSEESSKYEQVVLRRVSAGPSLPSSISDVSSEPNEKLLN